MNEEKTLYDQWQESGLNCTFDEWQIARIKDLEKKVEELKLAYIWLAENTIIEDRGTKAQDSLERHERILKYCQEAG